MRKKTFVIIVSLISAFVLMSGGYGFWREPLTIIGNIEVRERPQPVVVAPLIPVILDPNQAGTANPDGTVIPDAAVNPDGTENPDAVGNPVGTVNPDATVKPDETVDPDESETPETPNSLEGNTGMESADSTPIDNSEEAAISSTPANDQETEDLTETSDQEQDESEVVTGENTSDSAVGEASLGN